jgi:F-type H+-transporting ATPase subunit delta
LKKHRSTDNLPKQGANIPPEEKAEFQSQKIDLERVINELELVNSSFRSSLKLRGYLENPRISFTEKQKTLKELFKDYISERTYDFIFLLVRSNALSNLGEILRNYQRTMAETGILEIEVKTAVPLTNEEKENLRQSFARRLQKPISIKNIIAPEIIGGMVIKSGDIMIDVSLKSKIQLLLKNLKQG